MLLFHISNHHFYLERHWLTQREHIIDVKGKGMMQTFWCDPSKKHSNTIGGSSNLSSANISDDESVKFETYEI
jgi:hypothetical protein